MTQRCERTPSLSAPSEGLWAYLLSSQLPTWQTYGSILHFSNMGSCFQSHFRGVCSIDFFDAMLAS